MARAERLEDNGNENERVFRLLNNRIITIRINDDKEISYLENDIEIGNYDDFVFAEDEFNHSSYLLARMYVPITKQGLGRETIKFFSEYFDVSIWARGHDGIRRDDGSHLTEDAPGFVDKMIEEGLLVDNRIGDFNEPDDY